jgi:mono/diheme cytochrome c family protein
MRRTAVSFKVLGVSLAAAGLLGASGVGAKNQTSPSAQSPASSPDRLAAMRHHFGQVIVIHEALIRGDLSAVREPATELARLPVPPGMPPGAAYFAGGIQLAARSARDATTLPAAATATATMLRQCGDCHRTVGVPVAVLTPAGHDVGGVVGHMIEHQRAADDLLQGLVVPSASLWRQGAASLRAAFLLDLGKLPDDPKLTDELKKNESRVHAIALQAEADADADARTAHYAQLMVTCAECHSLHSRIWGPARGR